MQSRAVDHRDEHAGLRAELDSSPADRSDLGYPAPRPERRPRSLSQEAKMTSQQQVVDHQRLATVAEIDDRIASGRQQYIAAYFAGREGEAQFWVYDIARLENLRNIVQRQGLAS